MKTDEPNSHDPPRVYYFRCLTEVLPRSGSCITVIQANVNVLALVTRQGRRVVRGRGAHGWRQDMVRGIWTVQPDRRRRLLPKRWTGPARLRANSRIGNRQPVR